MDKAITPINITGAALLTQFSIIFIMFIGSTILYKGQGYVRFFDKPKYTQLAWILLGFGLVTIGCLIFSDEFASVWRPVFGNINTPTIKWSTAILIMFSLDIVCIWIFVAQTGGSRTSPFSATYFSLTALAIFLREPAGRVLLYLVGISVLFILSSKSTHREDEEHLERGLAFWFVSIACLLSIGI